MLTESYRCELSGVYLVTFSLKSSTPKIAAANIKVDAAPVAGSIYINDGSRVGNDILIQSALIRLNAGQELSFHSQDGSFDGGIFNIGLIHNH